MRALLAPWAVALLCIGGSACSYLIESPQARYSTAAGMDGGDRPSMDGGMDASDGAPDVPDAEPIEDASPDADAFVEAAVPPDAAECTRSTDCEARIEDCLDEPRCNEEGRCEYTEAADCTECGMLSVCVAGTCRKDGIFYEEDFEGADLGSEWDTSTTRPWMASSNTREGGGGSQSWMSTEPDFMEDSRLELTLHDVPFDARLRFWHRVDGLGGYDYLEVSARYHSEPFADSTSIELIESDDGWQPSSTIPVRRTESVTITWLYSRGSSDDFMIDRLARIDDVTVRLYCAEVQGASETSSTP